MDLDTVGAHILLMCYAGASPERYKLGNNKDKIRRLLGQKNDENFEKIWGQLLEGAWKISDDGQWICQEGMLRALRKQKEFNKLQQKRAETRWAKNKSTEIVPEGYRNDTQPVPEVCSSTSSTSTSTSTNNNINIYTDSSLCNNPEQSSKQKKTKQASWPPEGSEIAPMVYLTSEQVGKLANDLTPDELNYWISELASYAKEQPKVWKRKYKDHSRVIQNWRRIKLEKGLIWNETAKGYRYPEKQFTKGKTNLEKNKDALEQIIFEEAQKI